MEIAEMNREVHYFDQQLEAGHWKKNVHDRRLHALKFL
jgi:hypothetical protein